MLVCSSLLAGIQLLDVHGPDGQEVYINTAEISALRTPTKGDLEHYFPRAVHCVITTTNGKFVAALESCTAIRERLIKQGLGRE